MASAGSRSSLPAWQEADRLAALERYRILDTPADADFDDIVRIAARLCDVPIALVSLVDDRRQWFKAALGLDVAETPRDIAFCTHAIQSDEIMVVPDAAADDRFAANPLVAGDPSVRFYAGAPLITPDGLPLGTLCILDSRPRTLSDEQRELLQALARQVMTQLELRRSLARQRADEKRHRLIIASAVDYAIITLDLAGLVTSWNEGARRAFGWTEETMCGRSLEPIFTPEDRIQSVRQREMERALAVGRHDDERWHVRDDGTRFWASGEIMPLTGDDGEPFGFLKILRDRSAQRQTELALQHSETRTRVALEATALGTWEAIPSLGVVHGDARARELLHHPTDEVLDYSSHFLAHIHPADRQSVDDNVRAALAPEGSGHFNATFRTIGGDDGAERWIHSCARVVKRPGERLRLIGTVRDITADKAAEAHRVLLGNELQHRVKNTLAVVQGIVSQSLRSVATAAEAREAITSRLVTLGRAHDLLTRSSWSAAPLEAIIAGAASAHGVRDNRMRITGPKLDLKPRAALSLSMVIHELCTNALKYGALSGDQGRVEIDWAIGGEPGSSRLDLVWTEHGGPAVVPPTRRGFGSRLIETSVSSDLGEGRLEFAPAGVRWRLTASMARIQES